MKKVLIFDCFAANINDGGPSGFVAHNLKGFSSSFYNLLSDLNISGTKLSWANRFYLYKAFLQYEGLPLISHVKHAAISYIQSNSREYEFVFFHSSLELFGCLPFIPKTQKIILQSHSPELPSEEFSKHSFASAKTVKMMQDIEKKAFERANIVVFPNEGCVPLYEEVLISNNKIEYILSGAKTAKTFKYYPLDQTSINLLYIGRRNEIKGFDIVIEGFKKAYENRRDIRLFILGKGAEIDHEAIHDVGFTTKIEEWCNSVDFVINANRQSYFDLSMIEILATGTPILFTNNFGHKFYEQNNYGMLPYNANSNSLASKLSTIKRYVSTDVREHNRKFYTDNLTDVLYRQRLNDFIRDL